jgi:lysophospholipase L1-like esterase
VQGIVGWIMLAGHGWLAGAMLLLVLAAHDWFRARRDEPLSRPIRFAALLLFGFCLIAAPPVPLAIQLAWIAGSAAWLIVRGHTSTSQEANSRFARAVPLLPLITLLPAVAIEAYSFLPHRLPFEPRRIVVLGDSLSAGDFGESAAWPQRLGAMTGLEVTNLSLPSETTLTALQRLDELMAAADETTLVILQIGGNDLLSRVPARELEQRLRVVTSAAVSRGAHAALVELPALPGRWHYPAAQRRVARRAGVFLIPRRELVAALTCRGCVSDGLHLTDRGHEEMARRMTRYIE